MPSRSILVIRGFPCEFETYRYRIYRQSAEKLNRRYVVFGRKTLGGELFGVSGRRFGAAGRSLHRVAKIVELNAAVVAVIEAASEQALHNTRKRLDDRVDFIRRDPAGDLVSMATGALHNRSRLQSKLPRRLLFDTAFPALQHLFVNKALVPFAVTTCQTSSALFADCHFRTIVVQSGGKTQPAAVPQ